MKTLILTMTAILGVASAQAEVVFTSATDATATESIATDLLQTTTTTNTFPTPSNAAIANGTTGVFDVNTETDPALVILVDTYDITLDLAASPAGYDISQINSYTGWTDGRAGQSYTISFSTVADPATFTQITPGGTGDNAVSVTANGQPLVTNVFDDTGSLLGTGVAVIRFDIGSTSGSGNVWREIDVIGEVTGAGPPEITNISYDPVGSTVTLTWSSQPNTTYAVNYSLDLVDFDSSLDDSVTIASDEIPDDGDNITVTFPLDGDLENLPRLFFRIEI